MRKKQGFTLVELLVVMAIITILASIVVPNVAKYITRSRATKALGDITSIELALTKMVADTGRGNLTELFNVINPAGGAFLDDAATAQNFLAAQKVYTRTIYALLREGRAALTDTDAEIGSYSQYLVPDIVKKLGTSYLDVAFDPWGELYQIWPGPWPSLGGAAPARFRVFSRTISEINSLPGSKGGVRPDALSVKVEDPATGEEDWVGFSAPHDKVAFIYSVGENKISGQAVNGQNPYQLDSLANYLAQDPEFTGGGDDINNWDKERSWERFYN